MCVDNGIMKRHIRWSSIFIGIAISVAAWQFSQGKDVYIQAWVAHGLLHTAWIRTQASGHQVKPWPWAKTLPLARLSAPRLKTEQIVLSHANEKQSRLDMLAFALMHTDSSVLPGDMGNSVLNVHRDTYLGFLKALKLGDTLVLESIHNGRWHYQVSAIYVVDKADTYLVEPSLNRRLTLVSCYPCTVKDNRWRYVVVAEEIERMALIKLKNNAF